MRSAFTRDKIDKLFLKAGTGLDQSPVLLLNQDYRPLSTYPLSRYSLSELSTLIGEDNFEIVMNYGDRNTPDKIPSVCILNKYIDLNRYTPPVTAMGICVRDEFLSVVSGENSANVANFRNPFQKQNTDLGWNTHVVLTSSEIRKHRLPDYNDHEFAEKAYAAAKPPTAAELYQKGRKFQNSEQWPEKSHWQEFIY